MRDMNKWKDKVEFSLDNRQIFFLFFGVSVVGCFVFALGLMVGRKVGWEPHGEGRVDPADPLAVLESVGQQEDPALAFSFKEGLAQPATAEVPPTRDPNAPIEPPREDKLAEAPALPGANKTASPALPAALGSDAAAVAPALAGKTEAVPASAASDFGKRFTLQMKAFARQDEAERFAERLRGNGHDVRVEVTEVKGRLWHRVRLGSFDNWESAIAAKSEFEKSEHQIAYVVRL